MSSVSRTLAEWTTALRYEDLPAEVVECAKRFLYDSIGCAFGGYRAEDVRIATSVVLEGGGNPQATLIGSGRKVSAVDASFLNSLMIRALDFNDIYWKQDPSHPSDIIPAAMACGELAGRTGKDLILGIVLGHEIEMRLCEAAFPGIREVGWHHATLTAVRVAVRRVEAAGPGRRPDGPRGGDLGLALGDASDRSRPASSR